MTSCAFSRSCSCNICSYRSSSRRGAHRAVDVQDTDTHTAESTCSISARSQLAQRPSRYRLHYLGMRLKCVTGTVLRPWTALFGTSQGETCRLEGSACFSLETSDKFCRSFPEARELRLCTLASSLQHCMQAFASYALRRTCAFRLCETTRMRQRQHCSFCGVHYCKPPSHTHNPR